MNGCVQFDTKSNAYAVRTVEERHTSMSVPGNKAGETTARGNARVSSGRTASRSIPCGLVRKGHVSILEQLLHGVRYKPPKYSIWCRLGRKWSRSPNVPPSPLSYHCTKRHPMKSLISNLLAVCITCFCAHPTLRVEAQRMARYWVTPSTPPYIFEFTTWKPCRKILMGEGTCRRYVHIDGKPESFV